jgi:ribosomal protein S18 acetylase RimI-like enzyme
MNQNAIKIKIITFGSKAYNEAVNLRYKILRKPLGLKYSIEQLSDEKYQIHIAAFVDNKIIGTLLLQKLNDQTIKMRQVAIDINYQKKGVGQQLVGYAETFAKEHKYHKILLHARKSALRFYLKLNYQIISEEFTEVGLPHYKMQKILQ